MWKYRTRGGSIQGNIGLWGSIQGNIGLWGGVYREI